MRDITDRLADLVSQMDDPGIFGEALTEIEQLRRLNGEAAVEIVRISAQLEQRQIIYPNRKQQP